MKFRFTFYIIIIIVSNLHSQSDKVKYIFNQKENLYYDKVTGQLYNGWVRDYDIGFKVEKGKTVESYLYWKETNKVRSKTFINQDGKIRDGIYYVWREDGTVESENKYINGKLNFAIYYMDNKPQKIGRIDRYLNDSIMVYEDYFENGQTETTVINNIRHFKNVGEIGGDDTTSYTVEVPQPFVQSDFYPNGKIKSIISYYHTSQINGWINGAYTCFYDTGTIKETGTYILNVKLGWFYYFKEDGSLLKKELYENGKLIPTPSSSK